MKKIIIKLISEFIIILLTIIIFLFGNKKSVREKKEDSK